MSGTAEGMLAGEGHSGAATLDGNDLRRAFEAATRCLERHRDAINALNVFPVPDGDTGTNMLLTMRSVNEQSLATASSSAGEVMAAMAQGALLGARGNSGVILSQFFHGLDQGLHEEDECNGESLARAFELASSAAYGSVSKPVDGTMLTVIRELSAAASLYVMDHGPSADALSVWQVALDAAKEAVSRTPLQLPVLREAGVVDAGGQGVVTLLEGAWCYLSGGNVDELDLVISTPVYADGSSGDAFPAGAPGRPAVHSGYLDATEDELYGYCTQFLIRGSELEPARVREQLSSQSESAVVVGDESLIKVHVHVDDPGPVISYAVSLGTIDQVSITDMDRQHREFVALHRSEPAYQADSAAQGGISPAGTSSGPGGRPILQDDHRSLEQAVVAVAWGDGYTRLLKGLGCGAVVTGGQTMNPSTQELLEAASATGAREVILLPNNPNIIPAARQAAAVAGGAPAQEIKLHVIPSRTLPQGVAALLAFNPEGDLEGNLGAMESALATVKTIEVTTAVRAVTLAGLDVKEGRYIALLEGELVAEADSALSALQQALTRAVTGDEYKAGSTRHEVLTLYWGGETQEVEAEAAASQLLECIPGVDVEVVHGGQPHYHYIASLE